MSKYFIAELSFEEQVLINRRRHGYSVAELSELSGVPIGSIVAIENCTGRASGNCMKVLAHHVGMVDMIYTETGTIFSISSLDPNIDIDG